MYIHRMTVVHYLYILLGVTVHDISLTNILAFCLTIRSCGYGRGTELVLVFGRGGEISNLNKMKKFS